MADSDTSRYADAGGSGNAAVDVMAVLMRGWETARRDIESRGEGQGGGEEAGLFCGFAYSAPGSFCPFFYWHADPVAVAEAPDAASPSGGA